MKRGFVVRRTFIRLPDSRDRASAPDPARFKTVLLEKP
jgi:hypothetical protein